MKADIDELRTGSKEATNVALSDMDYLKRKVTQEKTLTESGQKREVTNKKRKKLKEDEVEKSEKNAQKDEEGMGNQTETNDDKSMDFERKSEFTIKLRGLPFHAKKKEIGEFLSPLKIVDIRLPKDSKNRPSGRAYVDLESKEALKDALKRHKDYIKGRYIEVFEDKRRELKKNEAENDPPWMENAKELAENKDLSIAEV